MRGASSVPVATADGYAIYAGGYAGADVVHRPTAEGTEDFVVFESKPDDTNPAAPWGRRTIAPGASRCVVRVDWESDVVYPAIVDPGWSTTGSLLAARQLAAAALLGSGKVLISGGQQGSFDILAESELYDPKTGTFAVTGSMALMRFDSRASVLSSGKVLVTGGASSTAAEVYDPATRTYASAGAMSTQRTAHTSTTLGTGKVLVAGGSAASGVFLANDCRGRTSVGSC